VNKRINNIDNTVWSTYDNQGDEWHRGTVRLGRNVRPFQIDISATRSFDVLGKHRRTVGDKKML